ncbi:hypothetical protein LTR53_006908 [Teratosphaeriaceae sp. CCFEE 6253]|nr:hypothetical protein LTR53_006908 [Teratosphaeriaceae sp. CCFEE 6253]
MQLDGRNVQHSLQPNPTPPDVYRTHSQPQMYQQRSTQYEQYQQSYPTSYGTQPWALPVQQQYPYQQPQQYYQPQQSQQVPSRGYYQPSPTLQHPGPSNHLASKQSYSEAQDPQGQHRSNPTRAAPPSQSYQALPSERPTHAPQHATPVRPTHGAHQTSRPDLPAPAAPTPQHRTVAHVQIPVQRNAIESPPFEMPRATKRRRSNSGETIAVRHPAKAEKSSAAQLSKQATVQSAPLTALRPSQAPLTPAPDVDYHVVLLSLADEHVAAAYATSSSLTASGLDDDDIELYHRLMSTALGCLESVLQNYRQMDPLKEARIRLRYATLLHEETENSDKAEEILSKGIALCERSRLSDLKYAMHHLLVRVMAKDKPKAAAKAVEKLITEVEALKLSPWIYTFRFLRVSFGLQVPGPTECAAVLKQLSAITSIAESQRHVAVQIVAATLEAMVQLQSNATDAVELAQRALAAARMHQLSPDSQRLPQLRAAMDCLDLVCALMQFIPDRIVQKMQQMQDNIDTTTREKAWDPRSTAFLVELGKVGSPDIGADTAGVMATTADGMLALTFDWLHQNQLYALGFLLGGVARAYHPKGDHKVEGYLVEGLKMIALDSGNVVRSLSTAGQHAKWQTSMTVVARLQIIAAHCAQSDWPSAGKALRELESVTTEGQVALDLFTKSLIVYLHAACKQGIGDLEEADVLYGSHELAYSIKSKESSALKDLQAVACLNRIQIMQHLGNQDQADALLAEIFPYVGTHANKSVVAAYYVIKAASRDPSTAMLKLKQDLQVAVTAGKAVTNNQLLCITMNLMTHMFFKQIVGEQAVKSARASRTLAKTVGSKLWQAVADKMFGDTLALCGATREADAARSEAEKSMLALPKSLRDQFAGDE